MNELRILVARLGWPCPSTRWWAIQELSAFLGGSTTKLSTEEVLLHQLSSCKLEIEVVEILFIFWIAKQEYQYLPPKNLVDSIHKHSILSDWILFRITGKTISAEYNLKVVPKDFEIPTDFKKVQGIDIPNVYLATMESLWEVSSLPFVEQMAFEWSMSASLYSESPYQGDLAYFRRSLGDGVTGSYSARTSKRGISAYLRTLAVAKKFWQMPPDLVNTKALNALPINPTLAFLKSQRPSWFPEKTDFLGDNESINFSLTSMIASIEQQRPGDELITFHSPVNISPELCVELSLVRWTQEQGAESEERNLLDSITDYLATEPLYESIFRHPLDVETIIQPPTFKDLTESNIRAWPLARALNFNRIGYLQHDLYPSRLFFPTLPGLFEAVIRPQSGHLEVVIDEQVISEFYYWNVGWAPVRPAQLGGNCGTALISNGKEYRKTGGSARKELKSFYVWRVRKLRRKDTYEEFDETISTGVLLVD